MHVTIQTSRYTFCRNCRRPRDRPSLRSPRAPRETLVAPGPPAPREAAAARGPGPRRRLPAADKLDTPEQLARELERMRERYAPLCATWPPAPAADPQRAAALRRSTGACRPRADARDFGQALAGLGEWERVQIPHYGGPLGRAVHALPRRLHRRRGFSSQRRGFPLLARALTTRRTPFRERALYRLARGFLCALRVRVRPGGSRGRERAPSPGRKRRHRHGQ